MSSQSAEKTAAGSRSMSPDVAVVGAGLTGLTAAYALRQRGLNVMVFERDFVVGGHSRSEVLNGVPYEPDGPHLFHTHDEVVWNLVTSLVDMLPYRHRCVTELGGDFYSWPLQWSELDRLDEWPVIRRELSRTRPLDRTNFETWCVSQMGETLYDLFIAGYTLKQWGRPGRELSASIGPKRVELRTNKFNLELFDDPFQGWPVGGYGALAEGLAANVEVVLGQLVTVATLEQLVPPGVPVIVTSALDDFFCGQYGTLEWRGIRSVGRWVPGVLGFLQPALAANRPSLDVPYTRTVETKWVLDGGMLPGGTMVLYEYPGAPSKHYPVPDVDGENKATQDRYEAALAGFSRNPLLAAGRLARYTYINMDQAMRDGLDVASWAAPIASAG